MQLAKPKGFDRGIIGCDYRTVASMMSKCCAGIAVPHRACRQTERLPDPGEARTTPEGKDQPESPRAHLGIVFSGLTRDACVNRLRPCRPRAMILVWPHVRGVQDRGSSGESDLSAKHSVSCKLSFEVPNSSFRRRKFFLWLRFDPGFQSFRLCWSQPDEF